MLWIFTFRFLCHSLDCLSLPSRIVYRCAFGLTNVICAIVNLPFTSLIPTLYLFSLITTLAICLLSTLYLYLAKDYFVSLLLPFYTFRFLHHLDHWHSTRLCSFFFSFFRYGGASFEPSFLRSPFYHNTILILSLLYPYPITVQYLVHFLFIFYCESCSAFYHFSMVDLFIFMLIILFYSHYTLVLFSFLLLIYLSFTNPSYSFSHYFYISYYINYSLVVFIFTYLFILISTLAFITNHVFISFYT